MITIPAKELKLKAIWSKLNTILPTDEELVAFVQESYQNCDAPINFYTSKKIIIYLDEENFFRTLRPKFEDKLRQLGYKVTSEFIDKYRMDVSEPELQYYTYQVKIEW